MERRHLYVLIKDAGRSVWRTRVWTCWNLFLFLLISSCNPYKSCTLARHKDYIRAHTWQHTALVLFEFEAKTRGGSSWRTNSESLTSRFFWVLTSFSDIQLKDYVLQRLNFQRSKLYNLYKFSNLFIKLILIRTKNSILFIVDWMKT